MLPANRYLFIYLFILFIYLFIIVTIIMIMIWITIIIIIFLSLYSIFSDAEDSSTRAKKGRNLCTLNGSKIRFPRFNVEI